MKFFKSLKFRLTLWSLVVITVLLSVFGTVAYFMLSYNLYRNLDESLRRRVSELQSSLELVDGQIVFEEKFSELVMFFDADGALLQILGPNVEFENIDSLVKKALFGESSFLTAATADGQQVRLYAAPFTVGPTTRIAIVVGRPPDEIKNTLAAFRSMLGLSALAVIALAGTGGMFLAGRALKPVEQITGTAREIGESDLSRRIEVESEDELGRLATTLNQMIGRLEEAFNRQRQFTADASHELRTPLAVIQAESTLATEKERTPAEYRKSLELVSQEVAYMSDIIGKLLFLARSDAGKEPLKLEDINLKQLLTELSLDVEVLCREKGLQFNLGNLDDLTVKGDKVKLRQLFTSLLENAVKYTESGGSVTSSVELKNRTAVVAVSDTGIGIAPEHLPRLFERFYRVDTARSRADGGSGLGLAIAKTIAEAHGGRIEVESDVGKGSTFRVILPLSVPDPQK